MKKKNITLFLPMKMQEISLCKILKRATLVKIYLKLAKKSKKTSPAYAQWLLIVTIINLS